MKRNSETFPDESIPNYPNSLNTNLSADSQMPSAEEESIDIPYESDKEPFTEYENDSDINAGFHAMQESTLNSHTFQAELKPAAPDNSEHETVQKTSIAGATLNMIKNDPSVNKAIGKGYRKIKKLVTHTQKTPKRRKKEKIPQGFSQDAIPIKSIQNGIIQTTSGMFIKILEVLPINFNDMTIMRQNQIVSTFASIFHEGPSRVHLKCITDKNNPARMISYIKQKCEEEKWQRGITDGLIECTEDYIQKIKDISYENTLTKRYFFIYRYEGKSFDINDILTDMDTTRQSIKNAFVNGMGNPVIDYGYEKSSYEAGEILYYILNRKTCREETFSERIERIVEDADLYNSSKAVTKKKDPLDVDFFAPKGLVFSSNDYAMIDGQYVTYFALKEKGHPDITYLGWLDRILSMGDNIELDVYISRKDHDTTLSILSQYTLIQSTPGSRTSQAKMRERMPKINNNSYIVGRMNNGEDLFDVMIIITLRADSIKELRFKKQYLLKEFNKLHLYVEDAYANIRKFFYMTLPLFEVSSDIFTRNKRNYLTSSLTSLYMFSGFEFNDYTGGVLGQNALSGNFSMVALNPFNRDFFANANISILGVTGGGKTYSLQILARAMRIASNRVFMIIPLKGHEYYRGCKHIDGAFIHLYPGGEDCINVCEIRPSMNIDKDVLTENIGVVQSLLSNQISFLLTWIDLNIIGDPSERPMTRDERDIVEAELVELYNSFEITNDNHSIYDKGGSIKRMPVIGDIYDRLTNYPELRRISKALEKYVVGNCKNMNGQTNVDLTKKFIVVYVDENNMPKDQLPPFLLLTIQCAYNLAKQNRLLNDIIIIDEAWKILMNKLASNQVLEMCKIVRGYGAGLWITTQDIDDLLNDPTGKAILAGTAIKLILYLEETQARKVANELGLTEDDVERITHFKPGQALLITRHAKICINIIPSDMDDRDFTTDTRKLRIYAENEAAMSALIKQTEI